MIVHVIVQSDQGVVRVHGTAIHRAMRQPCFVPPTPLCGLGTAGGGHSTVAASRRATRPRDRRVFEVGDSTEGADEVDISTAADTSGSGCCESCLILVVRDYVE